MSALQIVFRRQPQLMCFTKSHILAPSPLVSMVSAKMMLYMLCFAMLFVSFSGFAYTRDLSWKPANVTDSPGCGFRKYTQTDYTTNTTNGLVQFIYREYDRYHGPQWGPDDAILEYPWLDEWTILEARIAGTCNVVQQCSVGVYASA